MIVIMFICLCVCPYASVGGHVFTIEMESTIGSVILKDDSNRNHKGQYCFFTDISIIMSLMYISSVNTWALVDSSLAQPVKELDMCLLLCVIRSSWDRLPAEPINDCYIQHSMHK